MSFLHDIITGDKKRPALPAKTKEQMPNAKLGIPYKEWHNNHVNKHKWRNRSWAFLIFINVQLTCIF
jgi:hypothetical protein